MITSIDILKVTGVSKATRKCNRYPNKWRYIFTDGTEVWVEVYETEKKAFEYQYPTELLRELSPQKPFKWHMTDDRMHDLIHFYTPFYFYK